MVSKDSSKDDPIILRLSEDILDSIPVILVCNSGGLGCGISIDQAAKVIIARRQDG